MTHVGHLLLHQVQDPAGGGDHQVNLLVNPHDIILQIGAACKQGVLNIRRNYKITLAD